MTLKKLSSKTVFTVFKTQLYQMRMLLILFGLILLVFPTLLTLGEFTNRYWGQYEMSIVRDHIWNFVSLAGFAPMFGLGMGMAVAQFGYLHKRQKLDYFHALPVRRSEHFVGRMLAALASLLGAAVLVGLGQTFALAVTLGWAHMEIYAYLWYVCLMIVIPAFAAYLFTVLIIVLTATLWETIFSLLAVSAVYPVAVLLTYVVVVSAIPVNDFYVEITSATVLSPLLYCIGFVISLEPEAAVVDLVVSLIVEMVHIAVCGGLALWFFCRRKSELAETGGATRFKLVVRFSAAVCAVSLGSLALLWVTDDYIAYLAGSVLGLIGAWLVMELLYTRSLRKVMRCIVPNVIGYAVFVVINMLVAFGFIGVPGVPSLEDINAVSVYYGREEYTEGYSVYENFHGNTENVYTDMDNRHVSMGSFDAELVRDGRALAEAILENQKDLYFPYLPSQWGDRYRYNQAGDYVCYDVSVQLYTEDEVISLAYYDYAENGRIKELYEGAKAIAAAPDYKQSNPSLVLMEKLDYVLYTNYETNVDSEQYSMRNIADKEDFIHRLQEAYLEDMYSPNVENYVEYTEKFGIEASVETAPVPTAVSDEYTLYVKVLEPITLKGGIIDDFYPAVGLECWLMPEFTPAYEGDPLTGEELAQMGNTMYFYRRDFPKTCAVLDELRTTAK